MSGLSYCRALGFPCRVDLWVRRMQGFSIVISWGAPQQTQTSNSQSPEALNPKPQNSLNLACSSVFKTAPAQPKLEIGPDCAAANVSGDPSCDEKVIAGVRSCGSTGQLGCKLLSAVGLQSSSGFPWLDEWSDSSMPLSLGGFRA